MAEQKYLMVRFRGETYQITVEEAHMLNQRGHLRPYAWNPAEPVRYLVEDDVHIDVRGEPIRQVA